ncbi:hypothetical protein MNBD_UNCLBAC01-1284 [hydrothermal vent metagenome]|uniref:Response regulatory domain-containing protein n=1 Tax=hydrothermal vent metagenome TaxID=652676 RepID=A0A3B1DJ37_9ZZZZ
MQYINKKILIVDDDPVQTKLLEHCIGKEGYEVLFTNEAADGLQMAMDENIDVLILDVMMPIINGYNFCKLLKSEENHLDIPVIFLTSRDEKDDIAIGHEMGASAYMTKPVDIKILIKKIQELLEN